MATKEKAVVFRPRPNGIYHEALTMALGLLVQRIQTLDQEDREDLFELMKDLPAAADQEELDSVVIAMREILDQEPVRLLKLDQTLDARPGAGLEKWMDFVGNKIKTLRKEAGHTQEELAERSGLPHDYLKRLENGKQSPSRVALERLAKALNVEVAVFDLQPV